MPEPKLWTECEHAVEGPPGLPPLVPVPRRPGAGAGRGGTWGWRLIRNGAIRWHGRILRPIDPFSREPAYEGQLDGMWGLFYTYTDDPADQFWFDGQVQLHHLQGEYDEPPRWPKPPNAPEGYYWWTRWNDPNGVIDRNIKNT